VVGVEESKLGLSLDVIVDHDGQRHPFDASSVELLAQLPDGAAFPAVFLTWK